MAHIKNAERKGSTTCRIWRTPKSRKKAKTAPSPPSPKHNVQRRFHMCNVIACLIMYIRCPAFPWGSMSTLLVRVDSHVSCNNLLELYHCLRILLASHTGSILAKIFPLTFTKIQYSPNTYPQQPTRPFAIVTRRLPYRLLSWR
jgi:hypothetical protein